jgi:hypothetical protein
MPENSFETSHPEAAHDRAPLPSPVEPAHTLPVTSTGAIIELRTNPTVQKIVPAAVFAGALLGFAVLSTRRDPNGVLGIIKYVVLAMELSAAFFLMKYFNVRSVRADTNAVTTTGLFGSKTFAWSEIATCEVPETPDRPLRLLDKDGRALISLDNTFATKEQREQFTQFVQSRLNTN